MALLEYLAEKGKFSTKDLNVDNVGGNLVFSSGLHQVEYFGGSYVLSGFIPVGVRNAPRADVSEY